MISNKVVKTQVKTQQDEKNSFKKWQDNMNEKEWFHNN